MNDKSLNIVSENNLATPWAVINSWLGTPLLIDHVFSLNPLFLLETENQCGHPSLWNKQYIKLFPNSHQAVNYFFDNQKFDRFYSKEELTYELCKRFPSAITQEKEQFQLLYDTLLAYKNRLSSQSQPKCTPSFNLEQCGNCRRHEKSC